MVSLQIRAESLSLELRNQLRNSWEGHHGGHFKRQEQRGTSGCSRKARMETFREGSAPVRMQYDPEEWRRSEIGFPED